MEDKSHSSQTARIATLSPTSTLSQPGLDLANIPPIAILTTHLKDGEEYALKETLRRYDAPLTTNVSKAKIFIGKVGTKRRAEFELRSRKLIVQDTSASSKRPHSPSVATESLKKRRRPARSPARSAADDSETFIKNLTTDSSETEDESALKLDVALPISRSEDQPQAEAVFAHASDEDVVWIIKSDWLDACVSADHLVPLGAHQVYKGQVLERPPSHRRSSVKAIFAATGKETPRTQNALATRPATAQDILDRAKADISVPGSKPKYEPHRTVNHGSRRFDGKTFAPSSSGQSFASNTARLLQRATTEYEGEDSDIPQPPVWVRKGVKYACQRFTPADGPNEDFLNVLKKIRTARTLINDDIGVRAYSTIIASIAAYPFKLKHPREVARLPGCDEKTAVLFVEWKNTGKVQAVEDFEQDEAMKVLRSFYDIWGVGAKTARNFYFNNHWTELDDIIEYGWNDLDRVQQIGVKYYDEFLDPIPRAEVEQIASVVRQHAVRLRDERITVTIVGGYRRGKTASGDVDMIVSHPDLDATAGLVQEIVEALEHTEWITHTLTMSLKNTHRGQQPLPFRSAKGAGAGFDTLDKALVVWQDPNWEDREQDRVENPKAKNPNIHRRVDIIVSPWRTVGCAVMGWSGGTTFQRDLRRYAKAVKGWKFDSSGVRSRSNGEAIQLEGPDGVDGSPEDAERRVFEGLGLEYVPPEYRVTY